MFIFSNTTIQDSDVLINNILIMLQKKVYMKVIIIMMVCPCTKLENTFITHVPVRVCNTNICNIETCKTNNLYSGIIIQHNIH